MLGPGARTLQLIAFVIGDKRIVQGLERLVWLDANLPDAAFSCLEIAPVAELQPAADQIPARIFEVGSIAQHRLAVGHGVLETA